MINIFKIGGWTISIAIALFVIVSVVLFIKDGIAAKREGRRRKAIFTAMFIAGMTITALAIVFVIFLSILGSLVMRSM